MNDIAIQFIQEHGNPSDLARLDYLLTGMPAPQPIRAEFQAAQRADGGWSPFWMPGYSSLDATCFRLAQAQQLGLPVSEPPVTKALRFLADRQQPDGLWEEDQSVAALAPPWVQPGDRSATLYLTANCAYWLAYSQVYLQQGTTAAFSLAAQQESSGRLPSFLQTHWLCAGLWLVSGLAQPASLVLEYLRTKLDVLSASNLTWMITTLRSASLPADHPLLMGAISRLVAIQQPDGRWQSDDGPGFDVHVALEALYALKLCEKQ